jgi:hypothetical protein
MEANRKKLNTLIEIVIDRFEPNMIKSAGAKVMAKGYLGKLNDPEIDTLFEKIKTVILS